MLFSILLSYSRAINVIIAELSAVLGIQLFFVGLKDVHTLILLAVVFLFAHGVKLIIDAVADSLMSKEMRTLAESQ